MIIDKTCSIDLFVKSFISFCIIKFEAVCLYHIYNQRPLFEFLVFDIFPDH